LVTITNFYYLTITLKKELLIFREKISCTYISIDISFLTAFKSWSKQFLQIYTIHVNIGSTSNATNVIPVNFVLLPGPTRTFERRSPRLRGFRASIPLHLFDQDHLYIHNYKNIVHKAKNTGPLGSTDPRALALPAPASHLPWLFPNKTKKIYSRLFKLLKERFSNFNPDIVKINFEAATIQAIEDVFLILK
jgi:hypothetical protein